MKFVILKKKSFIFIALFLVSIVISSLLAHQGYASVFFNKTTRKLPIYSVDRDDKKIAITFDCAYGDEFTDGLLKCMEEYKVKATFFLVEFWTTKYPDCVKKIDEAGHEIGTHSKTHSYMSKMGKDAIVKELQSSVDAIYKITNKPVTLFRAPYGDYNNRLIETVESCNYYTIQWDVDTLDWKGISAKEIAKRVVTKTKSGSIILCHNNAEHILEALPLIFSTLQAQGYEFVGVQDLIYTENYSIDNNGKQIKN